MSSDNAKEIQRLYRKIRNKIFRIIYDEQSDFCDLDPEVVANHYHSTPIDKPTDINFMKTSDPAGKNMNTELFTHREISKTLRACENTAPGTDGIIHNYLKQIDPKAQILILMYNLYLKF